MGMYKYFSNSWKNPSKSFVKEIMRQKAESWRREPSIVRVKSPTRLDKARSLGYKAKRGFALIRVRLRRGGARKIRPVSGRRQKAMGVTKFTRKKSLKRIAQDRAARRFPNMLVLNSYWTWEDGKHKWFEVIMIDPNHPSIKKDKNITLPAKI